jgi:hypothetical protein
MLFHRRNLFEYICSKNIGHKLYDHGRPLGIMLRLRSEEVSSVMLLDSVDSRDRNYLLLSRKVLLHRFLEVLPDCDRRTGGEC